jgi:ElaB/YqjD/DUF883 family membrane-anchored ribosome-binding protein
MATGASTQSDQISNGKLKHALASVGDGVSEVRQEVGHLASAVGDEIKARADAIGRSVMTTTSRAVDATRESVRQRPAAALGVAAGAGLLVGLLLAARR